jgi:acyl-coenzyme A synthetase/AMP-(fatty) acid ligase
VFTSGSTGEPKRVAKTLSMLEAETDALERLWGEEAEGADSVGTVTHQHVFGLTFGLAWPLAAGRPFSAVVHHTWEALLATARGPAVIVSSPAHLTRLAGVPAPSRGRRPRLVFTAGAPLPPESGREVARLFGQAPIEIFGSTETGAIAWRRGRPAPRLWTALPGVEVERRPDGLARVTSPFAGGEAPVELADRVEIAADGRLSFAGRADGVVKIEGKRASLAELERALCALPSVAEAAVIVLPGPAPALAAAVVPSAHGRAELEGLGTFRFARALRGQLARVHEPAVLPRRWRFPVALPIDGMGKRRLSDLLALFDADPVDARRRA